MFREAAAIGGLEVQLVYYRGTGECRASRWVSHAEQLAELMERIDCRSGHTQIGKILAHAKREARARALVFVGDAMEERLDDLAPGRRGAQRAGLHVPGRRRSGRRAGVPRDRAADPRRLLPLRSGAAHQLGELLRAAAAYAVGGTQALAGQRSTGAALLLQNLQGKH